MVERNLAKVEVASSRLVSRSSSKGKRLFQTLPFVFCDALAEWQSGYAAACKAVYLGSIPGSASSPRCLRWLLCPWSTECGHSEKVVTKQGVTGGEG
ncbi:MAG: hypothetical protein RIR74_1346 [Pseudomonadota bacterium]